MQKFFVMKLFNFTEKSIYTRMGYDLESREYYYRYRSRIKNWGQHLLNTKRYITIAANGVENKNRAVVLGSGWCFDVPVMELSRMFNEVVFIDIVHPSRAMAKAANFPNVKFVVEDITKMVAETYNSLENYKNFTIDILICSKNYKPAGYVENLNDFDFVVSVNTLAFLDNLIVDYLDRKELLDDFSERQLITEIQQSHIDSLPKGKSCLITPVRDIRYNTDKLEIKNTEIIQCQLPEMKLMRQWNWDYSFSPLMGSVNYLVTAGII